MKILITGANGMLGHRLALEVARRYETYVTQYGQPVTIPGCQSFCFNLTNPTPIALRPDLIIHTAALTDVDYCEEHPAEAWNVNVTGTANLVKVFPKAKLVYISTDFVYDGESGNYCEADHPNPINVYGKTKHTAESFLPEGSLVIRTCIFGHNLPQTKTSLPEKLIDQLKTNQHVNLFHDLYSTPIYTGLFTRVLLELIARNATGIWNLAGSERVSKYELGLKLAEVYGLNSVQITPGSARIFPFKASRPLDVSLNTTKISVFLGQATPSITDSLIAFKEEQDRGYQKAITRTKSG